MEIDTQIATLEEKLRSMKSDFSGKMESLKEDLKATTSKLEKMNEDAIYTKTNSAYIQNDIEEMKKRIEALSDINLILNNVKDNMRKIETEFEDHINSSIKCVTIIENDISQLKKDMNQITATAQKNKLTWADYIKLAPPIITTICFISGLAWYVIESKVMALLH